MLALVLTVGVASPLGMPYIGTDDSAHLVTTAKVALPTPSVTEDANDRARRLGHVAARSRGYSSHQWKCMDQLAHRESRWNPNAKTGSFYGVFQHYQLKPGTPLNKQLVTFFKYIDHRYQGDPCNALAHSFKEGWY